MKLYRHKLYIFVIFSIIIEFLGIFFFWNFQICLGFLRELTEEVK